MKRFLPLLFAFLLILGLSACGDSSKTSSMDTIRNSKTGDTISLGMSRDKVEKKLGKGTLFDYEAYWKKVREQHPEMKPSSEYENVSPSTSSYPDNDFIYGKGDNYLLITYDQDLVAGFSTDSEEGNSNWSLANGITYGSSLVDVTNSLGEKEKWPLMGSLPDGTTPYLLSYYLKTDGKQAEGAISSDFQLLVLMDEAANTVLNFSLYKNDPSSKIESYHSIFKHKNKVQILDVNNKDITQEYFERLTPYYEKGDWQALEDGEMELQISTISGPSEP